MHACVVELDLHLPQSTSLKAKRAVLNSLIAKLRNAYPVAVAEVAHQDTWQRIGLGVGAVSSSAAQVEEILDAVERHVWSVPELVVGEVYRTWLETD